ncbi:MAG: ferrous iron transport protein B [Desulfocapsaceae bacterium]|jgi:ferrous iron transport protein B|nr:ferrous iron transport protein B [Desulfocapsaceae bacterium]
MTAQIVAALAGNPNAGKTTLFNRLTGARQHVGNYPGITVDRKEGYISFDNHNITLVDLPGTYSLTAYSVEELVARDFLVNERPQVVINIVDASNLERNLYLTTQFLELGVPMVIALNMIDVAKDRGITIKAERLSELLGVPVIPIVARSGKGTDELLKTALAVAEQCEHWNPITISYGDDLDQTILSIVADIENSSFLTSIYPSRFTAIKYLENDEQILIRGRDESPGVAQELEKAVDAVARHLLKTVDVYPESIIADQRYGFLKSILREGVVTHNFETDRLYTSDRIDKIVTNRLLGPVIMLLVLFGLYHFTFTWSEPLVAALGYLFNQFSSAIDALMTDGPLKSMIISGIIDGVGGVLGFVPLIMFMFFGIAVLEDSGYLARVAYMMDRVFRSFGLHGSSVMPFIVSGGIAGGCAVPGVMATRTLRSPKERMATLLTVPFMNCGAKIPVLALLIGAFFSEHRALFMFLFTMLAWVVALFAAKFLRMTILRGEATPFVMELPPYRFPTLQGLMIHTWERTWQYIRKAGTVILGISILLWALMTFPSLSDERLRFYENERDIVNTLYPETVDRKQPVSPESLSKQTAELHERMQQINRTQAKEALKHSIAGRIGTGLETLSQFAGFDWRTNIALVGGFAAKEVIVSTLGTAYSMGEVDIDASDSLGAKLIRSPNWNRTIAIAALVFIMFYAPCFVTVVCIAKEASWKWAVFSMAFNTAFAYLLAVLVFQVGTLLNFG